MAKDPPPELQETWLSAVLLPGVDDPRASCLRELSEYLDLPVEEAERRCERAVDAQRDLWNEKSRDSKEALVEFYNECDAYLYELLWWHALQQGLAPAWNARLVEIAREHKTKRYLDFGGGIGTNAILLGQRGIDVTVADVSNVLQKFAAWRLERREIPATLIDLKTNDLEPESYDLVSAVDVLEHVPDPLDTLRKLHRTLKPGGVLVFDLIASKPDPNRPFHLLRSKYPIRATIRGIGFKRIDAFQKYLVYKKISRNKLAGAAVRGWDTLKWRAYYLLQGKWPR